ncbi:glycoside hydrolase family 26 protein [Streptomyces sp. JJ36]|uniref:glycoside hydrolase family 26 protein n=1 Tax=Streptomyces sp. JJ36 TaxID=2736645 RepID=UPI001F1AF722|nr:glycosyl hydrolase [Streptomyces sp. JJ36]MCF6526110.1 glycosyl hydrolase family 26 [Streptomyces sp. JJ36]
MSQRRLVWTGTCIGGVTAGLLVATLAGPGVDLGPGGEREAAPPARSGAPVPGPDPGPPRAGDPGWPGTPPRGHRALRPGAEVPYGAFLGSGPEGVARMAGLERWLGGREPRVGHTYLPGDLWSNIEGRPEFLRPWATWRKARADRLFVLNVPMLPRNEANVPDQQVDRLLQAGAAGRFDHHFRRLAERLVRLGVPDTILVPGWEMNGTTYTHRCAPNPEAWRTYWRRIVRTMRDVPGQQFRFDFTPARGRDAIGWTRCYPGDDVVDIIGMDSYDQPPGETFRDQVEQPFGLRHHVNFAKAHGKPVSYPEWGLFRSGDNPDYMRSMLRWFRKHRPVYQTITDYCPHGVWQCDGNPRAAAIFRSAMDRPERPAPKPTPPPSVRPTPPVQPTPEKPSWRPRPFGFCLDLGDWLRKLLGSGPICFGEGAARPPEIGDD